MTNELEPCPFCGGEALPPNEKDHCVVCSKCHATGANWAEYDSAVEAWNNRYKRTCHNVVDPPLDFECSECIFSVSTDPSYGVDFQTNHWKFCPNCGAEVTDG